MRVPGVLKLFVFAVLFAFLPCACSKSDGQSAEKNRAKNQKEEISFSAENNSARSGAGGLSGDSGKNEYSWWNEGPSVPNKSDNDEVFKIIEMLNRLFEIQVQLEDKAEELASFGNYEEAVKVYDKLIEVLLESLAAENSNSFFADKGGTDLAYINLKKAYNDKGKALTELKRYDEAVDSYRQSIKTDLQSGSGFISTTPHSRIAAVLAEAGRYEEAVSAYDLLITVSKTNIEKSDKSDRDTHLRILEENYIEKGNMLYGFEKYEQAIEEYEKATALKVSVKNKNAYLGKAKSLSAMGKNAEAIKTLDTVLSMDPKNIDAYWRKALSLSKEKKYEQAVKEYDKAIALIRNEREELLYVHKANTLSRMNKKQEALKTLAHANENSTYAENGEAYEKAAEIYASLGEITTAADAAYKNFLSFAQKKEFKKAYISLRQYAAYREFEKKKVSMQKQDHEKWLAFSKDAEKDFFTDKINAFINEKMILQ